MQVLYIPTSSDISEIHQVSSPFQQNHSLSRTHILLCSDEPETDSKSNPEKISIVENAATNQYPIAINPSPKLVASKLFAQFQAHFLQTPIVEDLMEQQLEQPLTTLLAPWLVATGGPRQPLETLAATALKAHHTGVSDVNSVIDN